MLVMLSALLTAGCVAPAAVALAHGVWWLGLSLLALVGGCALFLIRGFTITEDAILVQRLLWATRLPLADLQSAEIYICPKWWQGIRIGNGGFFSFTGWRYNPGLGLYRVFVTDPRHAVALHYSKRMVVVSPSTPEAFINDLPTPADASPPRCQP